MSADKDAPSTEAIAISLNIPRILDMKVADAVIAPDFSSFDFFWLLAVVWFTVISLKNLMTKFYHKWNAHNVLSDYLKNLYMILLCLTLWKIHINKKDEKEWYDNRRKNVD